MLVITGFSAGFFVAGVGATWSSFVGVVAMGFAWGTVFAGIVAAAAGWDGGASAGARRMRYAPPMMKVVIATSQVSLLRAVSIRQLYGVRRVGSRLVLYRAQPSCRVVGKRD